MHRKYALLILLLLGALTLPSCALLPQEEAIRTAPLLRAYEPLEYNTFQVQRGDLIARAKVSCRYVPVQSASLSFALSDEYVDKIMVQAGAVVEEGQLLAQLQLGDLEQRIAETENAIAELELRHTYVQKRYELALRRHAVTAQALDEAAREEALLALQEDFSAQSQTLLDALTLHRLTLDALQDDLALRQIRAPFSGTVSRVSRVEEGDLSSLNAGVITLIDSTVSIFRATTEHWEHFRPGDEYEITVSKKSYRGVVTAEEALGLPPTPREPGKRADVYFALTTPAFELEEGSSGTIDLVLSEHLGVLYVHNDVLSASEGQPIVYYQREDGMKTFKPVETGVTVGDYTEILSGLSEGETIITE